MLRKNWHLIIIGALILCAFVVYVILGPSHVVVAKTGVLDTYIPQYKLLKDANAFFSHGTNIQALGSVTRNYYPTELSFVALAYMIFPTYVAYVYLFFAKIVVGMLGAILLCRDIYEDKFEKLNPFIFLISFAYSSYSFFPAYGVAFASIPFLVYLVRKLYITKKWVWIIPIAFYPLLSELFHVGIFVLLCLFISFVFFWIVKRKFPGFILISFVVLLIGYGLTQYRYFYEVFFDDAYIISGVSEISEFTFISLGESLAKNFLYYKYTNGLWDYVFVLVIAFLIWAARMLLNINNNKKPYIYGLTLASLLCAIGMFFGNSEYNDIYNTITSSDSPTYAKYYAQDIYSEALKDINYLDQWAIGYGIDSAVLEYNGINSINGKVFMDTAYTNACLDYYDEILGEFKPLADGSVDAEIDIDKIKQCLGYFIFSSAKINNDTDCGLTLINTYGSENELYVYKVISRYQEKEHSDIPYEERDYFNVDLDEYHSCIDEVCSLIEEANLYRDSHEGVSDEELVNQLGGSDKLTDKISYIEDLLLEIMTDNELADVNYYRDITDEDTSDLLIEMNEIQLSEYDSYLVMIRELCNSPYSFIWVDKFGQAVVDNLSEYEELTDEEKDSVLRFESLSQEYNQAMMEEYYFDYEGEEWTFAKFNEEAALYNNGEESLINDSNFMPIFEGLYSERAKVVGEIYLEIIQEKNNLAKLEGYDNYIDYAYEVEYVRDYTAKDAKKIFKQVRGLSRRYFIDISRLVYLLAKNDPGYITQDDRATYELIEPYIYDLDTELGNSLAYLLEYNLFDLKSSDTKADVGFTLSFESYGDGYILDSPYQTSNDFYTYIHEFGHYNAKFHNNDYFLISVNNLDTSEIHSQGLELLMTNYYEDMFGEEEGKYLRVQEIEAISNAIYTGSMISEFELYAFEHPDLTVEELGEYYFKLNKKYGYYYDLNGEVLYTWMDVPHLFTSPLYYVSYVTSGLGAFSLYSTALENRELGTEKYMEISALPSYYQFCETLKITELPDVFKGFNVTKIMKKISRSLQ